MVINESPVSNPKRFREVIQSSSGHVSEQVDLFTISVSSAFTVVEVRQDSRQRCVGEEMEAFISFFIDVRVVPMREKKNGNERLGFGLAVWV